MFELLKGSLKILAARFILFNCVVWVLVVPKFLGKKIFPQNLVHSLVITDQFAEAFVRE
jgi:hypothetical protein